jgi:hypothetical protein
MPDLWDEPELLRPRQSLIHLHCALKGQERIIHAVDT